MSTARVVEPEWLDTLPAEDPRAQRSRRDLVVINALMGNARMVASELRGKEAGSLFSIAEVGAGNGAFLVQLARAHGSSGVAATLLDRQDTIAPRVAASLAARGWIARSVKADVFDWLRDPATPRFDAIVANLFLHHFQPSALEKLLALVAQRTNLFVACEPRRSTMAMAGARMLLGANDVSRHDAVVSVRAGFRDGEISAAWPAEPSWSLRESARGLFSHVFVARKPS